MIEKKACVESACLFSSKNQYIMEGGGDVYEDRPHKAF